MVIGHQTREAIQLTENFHDAMYLLEIFKEKARSALPFLRQQIADMAGDGMVEERDQFRQRMIESLIRHLVELHGLE